MGLSLAAVCLVKNSTAMITTMEMFDLKGFIQFQLSLLHPLQLKQQGVITIGKLFREVTFIGIFCY